MNNRITLDRTEVADGIDEKCIAMLDHYGIAHK